MTIHISQLQQAPVHVIGLHKWNGAYRYHDSITIKGITHHLGCSYIWATTPITCSLCRLFVVHSVSDHLYLHNALSSHSSEASLQLKMYTCWLSDLWACMWKVQLQERGQAPARKWLRKINYCKSFLRSFVRLVICSEKEVVFESE